jgi:ABC-type nitrate/sulfonate/bicarbonate transport system permease component
VLGGVRIALAGAWGLETFAELLGAQRGLGQVMRLLASTFDTAGIFSAVLLISVTAVVVDGILMAIAGRVLQWRAV